MPKHQFKKIVSNSQGNMIPPESSHPMTARPEYSNAVKAQLKDLKNKIVKMIEVLKKEMKNSLKTIEGKTTKPL